MAANSKQILVWPAEHLPATVGLGIRALGFGRDGTTVLALDSTGIVTTWHTGPSLRRGGRTEVTSPGSTGVTGVFSPDHEMPAVATAGAPISVWDTVNGGGPVALIQPDLPTPAIQPTVMAFGGDPSAVLAIGTGRPDAVWKIDRRRATTLLHGWYVKNGPITSAVFLRDGERIAFAEHLGDKGVVKVTDLAAAQGSPVSTRTPGRRPRWRSVRTEGSWQRPGPTRRSRCGTPARGGRSPGCPGTSRK